MAAPVITIRCNGSSYSAACTAGSCGTGPATKGAAGGSGPAAVPSQYVIHV
jgi:hypothetical protein